jgi:hypothetical protein
MRKLIMALAVAAALLGLATPSQARPWGWYPYPYPYPYAYPYGYPYASPYVSPPVVIQPAQPPVVIQQPPQPQYWYFCKEANGYYPYVQQCPSAWMQVLPQAMPPAGSPGEPPTAAPPGPR